MVQTECIGSLPSGVSKKYVGALVEAAYKCGGGNEPVSVSVAVIGDRKMRELNRVHRGKDCVTDVLSFGYGDDPEYDISADGMPRLQLGDILICLPQVRRQSGKVIGRSVKDEFSLLVVHGALHLMGYDHETEKERGEMVALEQNALCATRVEN